MLRGLGATGTTAAAGAVGTGAVAFTGPALVGGVSHDITALSAVAFGAPTLDGSATASAMEQPFRVVVGRRYPRWGVEPAVPPPLAIDGLGSVRFTASGPRGLGCVTRLCSR
jgi:hypothetical protein